MVVKKTVKPKAKKIKKIIKGGESSKGKITTNILKKQIRDAQAVIDTANKKLTAIESKKASSGLSTKQKIGVGAGIGATLLGAYAIAKKSGFIDHLRNSLAQASAPQQQVQPQGQPQLQMAPMASIPVIPQYQ